MVFIGPNEKRSKKIIFISTESMKFMQFIFVYVDSLICNTKDRKGSAPIY
jgi:hypothetical protein